MYSSHSRFPIRTPLFAARHMLRTGRGRKRNGIKRTRRRNETPWRHRPETERFQMRRKREDREHERGITGGRTPTTLARTTDLCCYTKPRIRCFAICRSASMRDTVRYDMTRDGTRALPLFETTRRSPTIVIS